MEIDRAELRNLALEEAVRIIVDACTKLKCSVLTRCKALLIYHHLKSCTGEVLYDPLHIAAGCVSLGIKYNEEPVEYDCVVLVFSKCIEKESQVSTLDEKFKKMKSAISLVECFILRMIEFSTTYRLAHEYLAYFMNDIREQISTKDAWHVFVTTCTKLASDLYLSNRCLNYTAEDIASTVVQVALYMMSVDVHKRGCYLKPWIKKLHNTEESKRQDLIEDIFRVCDVGPAAERMLKNL